MKCAVCGVNEAKPLYSSVFRSAPSNFCERCLALKEMVKSAPFVPINPVRCVSCVWFEITCAHKRSWSDGYKCRYYIENSPNMVNGILLKRAKELMDGGIY